MSFLLRSVKINPESGFGIFLTAKFSTDDKMVNVRYCLADGEPFLARGELVLVFGTNAPGHFTGDLISAKSGIVNYYLLGFRQSLSVMVD